MRRCKVFSQGRSRLPGRLDALKRSSAPFLLPFLPPHAGAIRKTRESRVSRAGRKRARISGRAGELSTTIAKLNSLRPMPAGHRKSAARSTRNTRIQSAAAVIGVATSRTSIITSGMMARTETLTASSIQCSALPFTVEYQSGPGCMTATAPLSDRSATTN